MWSLPVLLTETKNNQDSANQAILLHNLMTFHIMTLRHIYVTWRQVFADSMIL